jgi:hypothetical protein
MASAGPFVNHWQAELQMGRRAAKGQISHDLKRTLWLVAESFGLVGSGLALI